ncbi:MAG: rhodanese-like domain-containing protein [Holophaga sp.]|nr:rhodanese-like domain-containing protein [Holophaga sp.]
MSFPAVISPSAIPPGSLLLDARPGPQAFADGHLPGALHADLNRQLSLASAPGADPARGGRHPLPSPAQWAAQLGQWGITPETWVVAYDAANGGNGAARLWWMLRAFGHVRAAVLDGGLQAGLAADPPVRGASPAPAPPYPGDRWLWPTVTLEQVERLRLDPTWKVLDVRSRPRYEGITETLDPVAGHIPGALNLPFSENLDPQGRFKSPEALRGMYQDFLAGTGPEHLVVHCGSGVTACHTLVALDLAGLTGAALYVGSWSEWCRNPVPRS